jgi:hypothetical protein
MPATTTSERHSARSIQNLTHDEKIAASPTRRWEDAGNGQRIRLEERRIIADCERLVVDEFKSEPAGEANNRQLVFLCIWPRSYWWDAEENETARSACRCSSCEHGSNEVHVPRRIEEHCVGALAWQAGAAERD